MMVLEKSHDAIFFQSWRLKIRMSNVSVTSTSKTQLSYARPLSYQHFTYKMKGAFAFF